MENKKEKLIEKYSYYFCTSKSFVEEYFNNFEEMEKILKMMSNILKKEIKEYSVNYSDCSIMIENKKTKESYKINIEF